MGSRSTHLFSRGDLLGGILKLITDSSQPFPQPKKVKPQPRPTVEARRKTKTKPLSTAIERLRHPSDIFDLDRETNRRRSDPQRELFEWLQKLDGLESALVECRSHHPHAVNVEPQPRPTAGARQKQRTKPLAAASTSYARTLTSATPSTKRRRPPVETLVCLGCGLPTIADLCDRCASLDWMHLRQFGAR